MNKPFTLVASVLGIVALTASVFSDALASHPAPIHALSSGTRASGTTVGGNLVVNKSMTVKKRANLLGHATMHNGIEVWNGLSVHSSGITVDDGGINVQGGGILDAGAFKAQNAIIDNNLQAGSVSGSTLTVSGGATLNGGIVTNGITTTNGITVRGGGIFTTGDVSANTGTITTLTVPNNLVAKGNVDFTGAHVTGLDINNIDLSGSTFSGATFNTLTIGKRSQTTAPLDISGNGKTVSVGVNSAGQIETDSLSLAHGLLVGGDASVAGALAVSGSGGVTASSLQAPAASGGSGAGPLTLQGGTISLNGSTSLSPGSDLVLPTNASSSTASHLSGGGNGDLAGTINVPVTVGSTTSNTYTFAKLFATRPVVVLTPTSDIGAGARYWVTTDQASSGTSYASFTVHFLPGTFTGAPPASLTFNYHVIG